MKTLFGHHVADFEQRAVVATNERYVDALMPSLLRNARKKAHAPPGRGGGGGLRLTSGTSLVATNSARQRVCAPLHATMIVCTQGRAVTKRMQKRLKRSRSGWRGAEAVEEEQKRLERSRSGWRGAEAVGEERLERSRSG